MLNRYFIKLTYSGANYCGWQIQPHCSSVQETISISLEKLVREPIKLVGCGRTDTGVHATCFYAHIDLNSTLDQDQVKYKLNKMLPDDISIQSIFQVDHVVHARFDAEKRTYNYYVHQHKDPFKVGKSWYYPYALDVQAMNKAAERLIGELDFTSFSKLHTDVKTNICNLTYAKWEEIEEGVLVFTITANRFLRNMVRAVVGTLIEVGRGKMLPENIDQVLKDKNRASAGVSVPPQGLFLSDVQYPFLVQ